MPQNPWECTWDGQNRVLPALRRADKAPRNRPRANVAGGEGRGAKAESLKCRKELVQALLLCEGLRFRLEVVMDHKKGVYITPFQRYGAVALALFSVCYTVVAAKMVQRTAVAPSLPSVSSSASTPRTVAVPGGTIVIVPERWGFRLTPPKGRN